VRSISRKIVGLILVLSVLSLTLNYLSPIKADQLTASGSGSGGVSGTGTNGQVTLWGAGNTLTGDTGLTYSGTGATWAVRVGDPATSSASLPVLTIMAAKTGFGGSAAGDAITAWTLSGGNAVNQWWEGADSFRFTNSVAFGWSSGSALSTGPDTLLTRSAAATLQLGAANAASPVSQTIKAQGSRSGTDTNVAGGSFTISSADATGNAAGTKLQWLRDLMGASGTAAQVKAPAETICASKTLSNTSATATALVNIGLANNTAGATRYTVTIICSDGTNFDSDIQSCTSSYVNKAGTITNTTPVCTTSVPANNSGSCTIASTVVANGTTSMDIKVTPVIGTIVPTTVTGLINVETFGNNAGAVTCQ
jgi:hypothetical protein